MKKKQLIVAIQATIFSVGIGSASNILADIAPPPASNGPTERPTESPAPDGPTEPPVPDGSTEPRPAPDGATESPPPDGPTEPRPTPNGATESPYPELIPYEKTGAGLTTQFKVNGNITTTREFTTDDIVDLSVEIKIDEQDAYKRSAIYVIRVQDNGIPEMKVGSANKDWQQWTTWNLLDLTPYIRKDLRNSETVNVFNGMKHNTEGQFSIFVAYRKANGDIVYNGDGGHSIGYTVVKPKPACELPVTPMMEESVVQGNHAAVSWIPAPMAEGYKLYYSNNSFDEGMLDNIDFLDIGNQIAIEADLKNGDKYYVAVQAYNCAGVSYLSHVELLEIPAETQPITIPTSTGEVFQDTLKDGSLGPEMVVIPAGSFWMGNIQGEYSNGLPVHQVNINYQFAMGKYEVTFAEYDKFAETISRKKPDDEGWGRGNRPVINVSWSEAVAYTKWLSEQTGNEYRLPSEAEWEYAAKAGTETKYWWGNKIGENNANCDGCGSTWDYKLTAPVGSFAANQFGLYDTVGNVWEWCSDSWHNSYENAPTDGSIWKGYSKYRVLRGGSWFLMPIFSHAANRERLNIPGRAVGFRVVYVL